MKRLSGISVIFLILLHIPAGMYFSNYGWDAEDLRIGSASGFHGVERSGISNNEDELAGESRFYAEGGAGIKDNRRNDMTVNHVEQDRFGGSWFDDFDNYSGVSEIISPIPFLADEHTVGLWHFDEGSGNEAKDESGYGNHGTLHGSEESDWIHGQFWKGLEFDGTGEHVDMGDPGDDSLEASGAYTVESWIKTGTTDADMIISKKGDGPRGFYLGTTSDGKLKIHFHGDKGVVNYDSISRINDNSWHYIAVVKDAGGVDTYVDGNLDVSSDSNPGDCSNTKNFKLGVSEHSQSFWYTGAIDEVRASNVARTSDEIQRNFEGGLKIRNGNVKFKFSEYRRAITVMNNGNALSDYQVQVNITSENFDYTQTKENGGGIRFYDRNGNKLNYWIEEWNTSGDSKIWVNVTDIPNGGSKIWMNYGDPWAESESDGEKTFDFFDDFNNELLDANKWTREAGDGLFSINNSVIHASGGGSGVNQRVYGNAYFSNNYSFRSLSKFGSNGRSYCGIKSNGGKVIYFVREDSDKVLLFDGTNYLTPISNWGTDWNTFEIINSNYFFKWYINDSLKHTDSTHLFSDPMSPEFNMDYDGEIWTDWALIRKYIAPEPISFIDSRYYNPTNATLISTNITPPQHQPWKMLSISKTEPENTYVNISIINAETNTTVPGYGNLTGRNILLHRLTDLDVTSIRLKANFEGNGSATPSLDSWGVEWGAGDSWRDSFVGNAKTAYPHGADEHTMGYWRFEEGCGNVAEDESVKGNDGTLHNMENGDWVYRGKGRALEFDGDDDHIRVPFHDSLDFSPEITLEAWVRPNIIQESMYIINKPGPTHSFSLWVEWDGQVKFVINEEFVGSKARLSAGEWSHVAGTYDGEKMSFFFNGDLDERIPFSKNINTSNYDLYLGNSYHGSDMAFNGAMDDIRIGNVARTPDEVREAYQSGIAIRGRRAKLADNEIMPDGNTSALWEFNDGDGDVLHDSSENGFNGIIHGANWTEGAIDKALEFFGNGEHVDCGNNSTLDFSGEMTISAWIYPKGPPTTRALISKANYTANQGYYLILRNSGELEFRQPGTNPANLLSGSKVPDNEWTHIAVTSTATARKIYINGMQDNRGSIESGMIQPCPLDFMIGKLSWLEQDYFRGLMDEVTIHSRVLEGDEIRALARMYGRNSTLRSSNITIPDNRTWESFHSSRSVPENTYLNVSVHDAKTGETLQADNNRTEELYLNMSHIDPTIHPTVYLQGIFRSNRTETPVLLDWAVNWTMVGGDIVAPELLENVPDVQEIMEDTPETNITDLSEYFLDIYALRTPSVYTLQHDPSDENITLALNGSRLDVTHLADNWTGNVSVTANCTNVYSLSTSTNTFNITVKPVDDAPAWNSKPPSLNVSRGTSNTSGYSLDEYVEDAEDDAWQFSVSSEDYNITPMIDQDNNVIITHSGDFLGRTSITATVFQSGNHSLLSNISITVYVMENIPLDIRLLSPRNGINITETNVTLRWEVTNPDEVPGFITYELHFGNSSVPPLYMSDLNQTNHTLTDLGDNTTYYWYVVSRNGNGKSLGISDRWSFIVNKSASIPEVDHATPLDGDTINSSSIQLTWHTRNPLNETLQFEVFVGNSIENLTSNGTTVNETYLLKGLADNTTYYWTIVPSSERITGRSRSGVWHFTVRKDFIPVFNISWSVDIADLRITRGDDLSFNLTLNNTGNKVNTVIIEKVGGEGTLARKCLLTKTNFNILPGASDRTNVELYTSSFNIGEHILTLKLVHGGGEDIIEIPVNITGETEPEPKPPDEDTSGLLLAAIVGIALIFITVIVVLVLIKKRRKKEEEEMDDGYAESEALEADIVEVPVIPGQTQAAPSQPIGSALPAPTSFQDARYQFKGREVPSMPPPPPPVPSAPGSAEPFDISKISIPSETTPTTSPVDIKQEFLALPPARFLEVKEEEQRVPIEEVFLMTPSGLLVQHYSLQRETGINEDVLTSMLSAVKSFILDSLSMLEKDAGEESEVNRIDVGNYSVMMASGKSLALVAISSHEKKEVILDQIRKGADVLEEKFGAVMIDWDGDMSKVEGVKPYIESLVKGEFDPESLKRQTEGTLPAPPDEKQELPSGLKTITIALPDPIKVPDTKKALPEKAEAAQEDVPENKEIADLITSLDDIMIDGEKQGNPETPPPAAVSLPRNPDLSSLPPPSEATSQDPSSIASSKPTTDDNNPSSPEG